MSEVQGDPMLDNMYKRINKGMLEKDERDFLIKQLGDMWKDGIFTEPKESLLANKDEMGPKQILNIPQSALYWLKSYCADKIYKSERGKNELNKRIMTGFVSVIDPKLIPSKAWVTSSEASETSEAVISQSIPPTAIKEMILPKYFDQYIEKIVNPYKIPLVFRTIDYPVEAEAHIYSASGTTVNVKREIDLHWRDEIARTMEKLEMESVLTSMTRGS